MEEQKPARKAPKSPPKPKTVMIRSAVGYMQDPSTLTEFGEGEVVELETVSNWVNIQVAAGKLELC